MKGAKAAQLIAAIEIARRVAVPAKKGKLKLNGTRVVAEYLKTRFQGLADEQFRALYLNRVHGLLDDVLIAQGDVGSVRPSVRTIMTRALQANASSLIVAHNLMFELSDEEAGEMVSQNVIPGRGKLGGASPMAFTEQGVAMLSSVLRSPRALQVNIGIMRAFVRLRELLLSNADLAGKLNAMEKQYDSQFRVVFDAIRRLMAPPPAPPDPPRKEIGFHVREVAPAYRAKPRKRTAKR